MSKPKGTKPAKPYPEYPLFAHAAGVWAKKIRGNLHYFGPWNDPDAALAKYQHEVHDLQAGRAPRPSADSITLQETCNRFLDGMETRLTIGKIGPRTFTDYQKICEVLIAHFGLSQRVGDLRPEDFTKLLATFARGPKGKRGKLAVASLVRRSRTVFLWAFESDLIDRPVKFGAEFKLPSREEIAKERNKKPKRQFSPEELQTIIRAAGVPMRAMVYLGVNCGLGPSDIGQLPKSALV